MPSVIRAAKLGDAAIIKSIIRILDNESIRVISSIYFNPELSLKAGNYSKFKANIRDKKSINNGINFFNKLNHLDHIQALIVKDGKVVSKEDNKGTKKMLSNFQKVSGDILIKFQKKKQDLRMDLPTVGLHTFKDCKKFGIKGIVMKSKKNIFLNKSECVNFANKNKIFIKII